MDGSPSVVALGLATLKIGDHPADPANGSATEDRQYGPPGGWRDGGCLGCEKALGQLPEPDDAEPDTNPRKIRAKALDLFGSSEFQGPYVMGDSPQRT